MFGCQECGGRWPVRLSELSLAGNANILPTNRYLCCPSCGVEGYDITRQEVRESLHPTT